jgi:hypothetical protein
VSNARIYGLELIQSIHSARFRRVSYGFFFSMKRRDLFIYYIQIVNKSIRFGIVIVLNLFSNRISAITISMATQYEYNTTRRGNVKKCTDFLCRGTVRDEERCVCSEISIGILCADLRASCCCTTIIPMIAWTSDDPERDAHWIS